MSLRKPKIPMMKRINRISFLFGPKSLQYTLIILSTTRLLGWLCVCVCVSSLLSAKYFESIKRYKWKTIIHFKDREPIEYLCNRIFVIGRLDSLSSAMSFHFESFVHTIGSAWALMQLIATTAPELVLKWYSNVQDKYLEQIVFANISEKYTLQQNRTLKNLLEVRCLCFPACCSTLLSDYENLNSFFLLDKSLNFTPDFRIVAEFLEAVPLKLLPLPQILTDSFQIRCAGAWKVKKFICDRKTWKYSRKHQRTHILLFFAVV